MRVLVTGGSGYIGAHTVRALRDAGHRVLVLDLREPPDPLLRAGVPWVAGDIRSAGDLAIAFGQGPFDAVVHLAAEKSVALSLEEPERFMEVNVAGTALVVEAAVAAGVGSIVFSSSAAVYGNPERLPIDETAPLRPVNPYGESKARAEEVLATAARRHGLRTVALRYFNAAGAAPDGEIGEDWNGAVNLVPVAIEAAIGRGQAIDVFGDDHPTPDGTAIRDYVHVVDLAEAHLAALESLAGGATLAPALNLGTGEGRSVREVLDAVARATGRAVPHRVVARRAGEASAVWADASAAARDLGWRTRFDFDQIVRTAVAWHRRGQAGVPVPVPSL